MQESFFQDLKDSFPSQNVKSKQENDLLYERAGRQMTYTADWSGTPVILLLKGFAKLVVLNMTGRLIFLCINSEVLLSYLHIRHPEQPYIEDAVSSEACQVESQEVKVETYNAENKYC